MAADEIPSVRGNAGAKQRNTKQRSLVLDVVRSHLDHPTADQIFQDVHQRNEKVSRATVYRNLNLLDELGLIQQVSAPVANRFDLRVDPHYHLMCVKCGSVVDAPLEYQQTYDEAVAEASGFRPVSHQALFRGVCPDCQKKEHELSSGCVEGDSLELLSEEGL